MIAIISPAKGMQRKIVTAKSVTTPRFMEHTKAIVSQMQSYSATELEAIFKISPALARELRSRFWEFTDEGRVSAVDSYDGVVYKHFKESINSKNTNYLQDHLRISSLLYGILRPLDRIVPYRMEGFVRLIESDEKVEQFWREIQTQTLIDDVNEAGGILLYLASKEEQKAFNWAQVKKAVRVIDFQFLQYKGDKLRQVVIYTKMARGEMIRYMLERKITNPEVLKSFEWEGYRYNDALSTDNVWAWVME
ncbi:MAG: YaaA family protein [Rikenellaceae bacterium]